MSGRDRPLGVHKQGLDGHCGTSAQLWGRGGPLMGQDKPWPGSMYLRFLSCVCYRAALAKLPVLSGPQHPICQMDRQSWRSLLASFLGGTSWANPSFSPSSGFSAEQRVSPGSAHPSHQCYCHYDDGHRAFTKCQAPCSAWACAVHFASFLAQGVHAMVLPPSPFYRWGAELRACQRVAQGHTANWPRHT